MFGHVNVLELFDDKLLAMRVVKVPHIVATGRLL